MDRSFLNQSLQLPFKIHQNYHNSFYGVRLCMQLKEKPVELSQGGDIPELRCKSLVATPSFIPVLKQLCRVLDDYGISSIVRCFSDPRPLIEVELKEVKMLLLHLDDLAAHLWVIVSNAFIEESRRRGMSLLVDDEEEKKWMGTSHYPRMHHHGNSCRVDVLLFCPKYSKNQRLIEIVPVTLANYEYAGREIASSFVFNFQSAMTSFTHQSIVAGMDLATERESVSLEDLQEELKDVTNWFHMGIILKISSSKLLGTLFNYKQIGDCLSELISIWYSQSENAVGDSSLSWSEVTGLMLAIGRQSLADNIARRYGVIPMLDYLDVAQSTALEISLSTDPDIMDTLEELKEKDFKLSEKLKVIAVYKQEKRVLEVSFEKLKENLEKTAEEIRYFIKMRQEKKQECEKIKCGITALNDLLELSEVKKKSASHKELEEMINSQASVIENLENEINSLDNGLNAIKQQAMTEYDFLLKEFNQLFAKSQQIHHLYKVIGLLQAKTMQPAIIIDHLLQQDTSKRVKSAYATFEVQLLALEEEAQEKMEEAEVYFKEEEVAQKQINNAERNIVAVDASVSASSEKLLNNGEDPVNEGLTLLQWLQEINESVKSREALLDASENRWSKERIRYSAGNEGRLMKEVLEVLSETCPPKDEDIDSGTTDTEEHAPLSMPQPAAPDCKLTPNTSLTIKLNHHVLLSVVLPEKMKLDQRKQYTVEILSLANKTTSSHAVYMDSSTSFILAEKFQPTIRGRHQLTIHTNNKQLKGSPTYNMHVTQSPHTFGYPVRMMEGSSYPYYIKNLPETSSMILSECKGGKVSLIDKSTGKKTMKFERTKLRLPCGVAMNSDGLTYIVDSGSHCVSILSKDGTLLKKVGSKGDAYAEFCYPYGLSLSPSAKTINICDHNNDRIQVFTSDMKFIQGVYAIAPFDIAFDSHSAMYVSDRHNHLVAVFNKKYQCINSIGGKGTEEGKLLEPRGIAIDSQDNLYVVEELNHRVTIFDSQGQFVTCFGQEGSQPGEFSSPQGIAIDDDGYVYVCDMLNNRIQVF